MRRAVWVSLLLVVGCTRGCPANSCGGGVPATPCTTENECELTEYCHEGYCQDKAAIDSLERCTDTPECKERGACRPGLTRSFLGGNSKPTCLVGRDEDCAASELCKTQGACSLKWTTGAYRDGYCAATTSQHCAKSSRCASHDECAIDSSGLCARSWTNCTGDPLPGFALDAKLGEPSQPGELADALLACRIEDKYKQTTSFVRIGTACVRGPNLGSDTPFLLRTKLAVGDRVEIAIQADPLDGNKANAGYVRAEYKGSSPFTSGTELPKLTCNVVGPEALKANAGGLVTRIEAGLERLRREQAYPDRLIDEPREAGGIRRVLGEAIGWLGKADPQIVKLQAALDEALVGWRKKLDAVIGKLAPSDKGPKGSTLRVVGLVCGEQLKPYVPGRDGVTDQDCGVEIAVRATQEMRLGGFDDLGSMWIARPGLAATASDARTAYAQLPGKPKETSLTLAAGDEATVLVIPQKLLPLAGAKLVGGRDKTRFVLVLDR